MALTIVVIHATCLVILLYLTAVMHFSKKNSLKTVFFMVNKKLNVVVCFFTALITADFGMAGGYIPCPHFMLFSLFKFVMNALVTAFAVALYLMVYIRHTMVTGAQLPATHRNEDDVFKYTVILWTSAVTVAMPVLLVDFRYDEQLRYFVSDPKSRPFLIFDIMEGVCATTCFLLSLYYTAKTIWFMHVHKKPWNLFLLHIVLSTFYPLVLIPFQWFRVVWRLFDCESCLVYATTLRNFASPVTLTVAFSIVLCSKDVRQEILNPFGICRKLERLKQLRTSKISTTVTPSAYN